MLRIGTLLKGRWAALLTLMLIVGCGSDGGGSVTDPTGEQNDDNTSSTSLNFFEEELVGLWYRFHSFDGSDNYYRFNADRTACKWEEEDGSNRRISVGNYQGWSVDDADTTLGTAKYRIDLPGSGLTNGLTFDFADNEIWPTGFSNLKYRPSNSGKVCE